MKKFIVIDGFDGSGKDTQSQLVYKMYKNEINRTNELNKISELNKADEANENSEFNKISELNKADEANENSEFNKTSENYIANESIEKVVLRSTPETDNYFGLKSHEALLKEGKLSKIIATIFFAFDTFRSLILYYRKADVLIFTRYLLASAYFPTIMVKPVYKIFGFILPTSHFMFYLDLPPEIAMERINSRSISNNQEIQSFENLDSLKKSREKASLISNDWIIIDASKTKNEISDEIKNVLLKNN